MTQTIDELEFSRGIWEPALNGDVNEVRRFLDKNPSTANLKDSSGYTALHYACRSGHADVVSCLLRAGADPNVQTSAGKVTPLQRAAGMGNVNCLKCLIGKYDCSL